ncbi:MAG: STAS domain-containing protein [Myxococcota bacterium]
MQINVKEEENHTVVEMFGALDAAASREAREVFTSLLEQGKKEFVIDLTGVDFIDSSGLGALVGFFKKVRIGEGDVKLAGLRQPIMKIFELTHLDRVFTMIPSAA